MEERELLNFLPPLTRIGLPLMQNVLTPLAKSILLKLELTTTASATDAAIHKKTYGSGMTTLIISNTEMDIIMKIVKSFEESSLLVKCISETTIKEAKEIRVRFRSMLVGILAANLLGNMLAGKAVISADEKTIRTAQDS